MKDWNDSVLLDCYFYPYLAHNQQLKHQHHCIGCTAEYTAQSHHPVVQSGVLVEYVVPQQNHGIDLTNDLVSP